MTFLNGLIEIPSIFILILSIFCIVIFGYLLGSISFSGIKLGTSGVFIVSLLFGMFFYSTLERCLMIGEQSYISNALKIVENLGLVLFATSVGLIAGPTFFSNIKTHYKSYVLIALLIVISSSVACIVCYWMGKNNNSNPKEYAALLIGILSGALTSTPAFSAVKATVNPTYEAAVTTGHGIAYLFGVVGVVLFVQYIPTKIKDEKVVTQIETSKEKNLANKPKEIDEFGISIIAFAIALGLIIGNIKIPLSSNGLNGSCFSLTATGGCLLAGILCGYLINTSLFNFYVDKRTLNIFREFGLVLFLIGSGIAGGEKFFAYFKVVYFINGIFMTIVPLFTGYYFARKILKLNVYDTLGAITGGMTSTPALGALIKATKTDEVINAYAATYPVALISIVLVSQVLVLIL